MSASENRAMRRPGVQTMGALVSTTFRFPGRLAPSARRVSVIASFNGWDSSAHPLAKTAAGDWTATVFLAPGRIVYCFSVDGGIWLDPEDEGRVPNVWGSEYSLRYVGLDAPPARACSA